MEMTIGRIGSIAEEEGLRASVVLERVLHAIQQGGSADAQ